MNYLGIIKFSKIHNRYSFVSIENLKLKQQHFKFWYLKSKEVKPEQTKPKINYNTWSTFVCISKPSFYLKERNCDIRRNDG